MFFLFQKLVEWQMSHTCEGSITATDNLENKQQRVQIYSDCKPACNFLGGLCPVVDYKSWYDGLRCQRSGFIGCGIFCLHMTSPGQLTSYNCGHLQHAEIG